MELRQIRYVLAVAKEGSFTRAAQRLNVSQSAISEQVKLLEGRLGFPLLVRTGRGAEMTEKGRVFLHEAERIATDMMHLEEIGRNLRSVAVDKVNIGMISGLANTLVPRLFPDGDLPAKMQVEIRTAPTRVIFDELFKGRLDLGFAVAMDPDLIPSGLTARTLFDLDLVLISAPGSAIARNDGEDGEGVRPVDLTGIAEEPIIMSELSVGYGLSVMNLFAELAISPRILAVVDNIETIKVMVQSGIGHALVPAGAADREAELGLIKILPIVPAHAITIECYRPRAGLSRHKELLYQRIIAGPHQPPGQDRP
jgi:DNA-binding transcriptional LysR family regulator